MAAVVDLSHWWQKRRETKDESNPSEARKPRPAFRTRSFPACLSSFATLWLVLFVAFPSVSSSTSMTASSRSKQCPFEPHGNHRYKVLPASNLCYLQPIQHDFTVRSRATGTRQCRRTGLSLARAGLEDREQDVARVREITRGVVQDLLGVATSAAVRKQGQTFDAEAIDVEAKSEAKMVVGFIGCGTISEAVVKGMCSSLTEAVEVIVSPRNAKISASLAAAYPSRVKVAADNQAVLDAADVVCIAVTPQVFEDVLKDLAFRPEHIVISFMSTVKISTLEPFTAPASSIVRMIPMPPIAKCLGPLPVYPPLELIQTLFDPLGTVVPLESEDEFAALMSASSMMAPFYNMQQTVSQWIASKGLDPETSARYVGALFHGISSDSLGLRDFAEITKDSQTPKGINEQSLKQLRDSGFYTQLESQLDTIYDRIQGKP